MRFAFFALAVVTVLSGCASTTIYEAGHHNVALLEGQGSLRFGGHLGTEHNADHPHYTFNSSAMVTDVFIVQAQAVRLYDRRLNWEALEALVPEGGRFHEIGLGYVSPSELGRVEFIASVGRGQAESVRYGVTAFGMIDTFEDAWLVRNRYFRYSAQVSLGFPLPLASSGFGRHVRIETAVSTRMVYVETRGLSETYSGTGKVSQLAGDDLMLWENALVYRLGVGPLMAEAQVGTSIGSPRKQSDVYGWDPFYASIGANLRLDLLRRRRR